MALMRERAKALPFFLFVGSIAGYFVYGEITRVGKPGVINIGQISPDFTIKDQNGHPIKLSDYRGKVVFLNFWATWCGPCVEEAPAIERLYREHRRQGFTILAVSTDLDAPAVARPCKSVGQGKSVALGGRRIVKNKKRYRL